MNHLYLKVNSARKEVILTDQADSKLAIPCIPHHLTISISWPEGAVVMIIQVCQNHNNLNILLSHQLPHGGDGAVQRVLRYDEAFAVVET